MTAIAYRDGMIAADRKVTYGNIHCEYNKIEVIHVHNIGPCVVALAGKIRATDAMKEHLKTTQGARSEPFPTCDPCSRYGIAVSRDLKVYPIFGDGHIGAPDLSPFVAEGNAFDFLMGAMAAGASARYAVELACEHCDGVGRGMNFYDVVDMLDIYINEQAKAPF